MYEVIAEALLPEFNKDINSLSLSTRSYNALKRAGIDTIGEAVNAYNHGKLAAFRDIGIRSYKEIETKLIKYIN